MDTTKVVFLLLSHILVSSGQGKGSKSRFDDILSKFGFGGSPVALEQQTQGPNVAHATKVKTLDVSQPFKKEGVKHDKKKFTDALSKFGFGLPDSSEKKKQKSPEVTKSLKQDIKKYAQLINPSRTDDKNKFKEALKQFGFSSSPTAAFPQGIASSIVLNESLNQPQLVQVVTSTFSPTHQILPRDSKRQTSQIHKTTIPTFTRERHTEIRKYTNKGHTIQDKKIKKHKKSKKNLNNVKKLNYPSKSHATVNDSTFFVTPKSLVHKKHKKKNGKESKIQNTLELKKTNSRQNNSRLHAKPKHLDQSHIELATSQKSNLLLLLI